MAKRVFFSFHYQDVADFRANVVRNSWVTKPDREVAGYFDASLWEQSRRQGKESLKRLINSGLEGTSVTAVLVGSETYLRPWVRYEIFKSFARGNQIVGIQINQILCKNRQTKVAGPNPFDYLSIKFDDNGSSVDCYEWNGREWILFVDVPKVSLRNPMPAFSGQMKPLSTWLKTYCWIAHQGHNNFSDWIQIS